MIGFSARMTYRAALRVAGRDSQLGGGWAVRVDYSLNWTPSGILGVLLGQIGRWISLGNPSAARLLPALFRRERIGVLTLKLAR